MSSATLGGGAKLIQTNYDRSILAEDALFSCEVCLTRGQIRAMQGLLEQFGWLTRWYSPTGEEIDQHAINVFQGDLSWRLANMCCGDGSQVVLQRINPDTGILEVSTDGGATYNPSMNDPRIGGIPQLPPVTSGRVSTKCDACQNATNTLGSLILQIVAGKVANLTNAEIATGLAAAIAALFGGGLPGAIVAIFGGVFAFLLEADVTAIQAAFTDTTYNEFKCLLYCHIGSDGSFDDAGYAAVMAGIATKITDTYARDCIRGLLDGLHTVGLNDWCANGMSSGADCSACVCSDCQEANWVWNEDAFGAPAGDFTRDSEANTISGSAVNLVGQYYFGLEMNEVSCCHVSVTVTSGTYTAGFRGVIACDESGEWSYFDETQPPWTAELIAIFDTPCKAFLMRSTTAFTVQVEFAP